MSNQIPAEIEAEDQESVTAGDERDVQNDAFVQLRSQTPKASFIRSHIPDIKQLGACLNAAVQALWPRRHQSRYSRVHVLMISWTHDDLGVWREIIALRTVLEDMYNFKVEEYKIPGISQPDRALKSRVIEFLNSSDRQDTLLIVYYAGHARRAPEENASPLWCANRSSPDPAIPSGGIQSMFEEANADVLLLYDCCHSASVPTIGFNVPAAGIKHQSHSVEVIAACGYETVAAEVDQHSFSKALTQVLALKSGGKPFSVGWLHGQILGRLKCCVPNLQVDGNGRFIRNEGRLVLERQPRRTPIYSVVCETEPRRNIQLASIPLQDESSNSLLSSAQTNIPRSDSDSALSGVPDTSTDMVLRNSSPAEAESLCPQLLLTIPLKQGEVDIPQWAEWIRNVPVAGTSVHVEGAYQSFSIPPLLHIPTSAWNGLTHIASNGSAGLGLSQDLPPRLENVMPMFCPNRDSSTDLTDVQSLSDREGVLKPSRDHEVEDQVVEGDSPYHATLLAPKQNRSGLASMANAGILVPVLSSATPLHDEPAKRRGRPSKKADRSESATKLPHTERRQSGANESVSVETCAPDSPPSDPMSTAPCSALPVKRRGRPPKQKLDLGDLTYLPLSKRRQSGIDESIRSTTSDPPSSHLSPTTSPSATSSSATSSSTILAKKRGRPPKQEIERRNLDSMQSEPSKPNEGLVPQHRGFHGHSSSHGKHGKHKESKKERSWHWEQFWFCVSISALLLGTTY
ncbi:uncharacterized protein PAC_05977 [Phialocephala subalpina]|uniref:Uncharacterized protein n=1 Tax=Phialocephala subalpina TaxID=576137 RepID=A0A1L7WTK9_9HELO|nr:uncharacterized protein PAC_05977 [Phialocephala subalpina]